MMEIDDGRRRIPVANRVGRALAWLIAAVLFWLCIADVVLTAYRYAKTNAIGHIVGGIALAPVLFGLGVFYLGAARSNREWFTFKRQDSFLTVRGLMVAEIAFSIAAMLLVALYVDTGKVLAAKAAAVLTGPMLGMIRPIIKAVRRARTARNIPTPIGTI